MQNFGMLNQVVYIVTTGLNRVNNIGVSFSPLTLYFQHSVAHVRVVS
jgi:hypothetical protein